MVAGQDVGYPVSEAARRLGLSPGALRKRIKRGSIPAYKGLDGQWYVPVPRAVPQASPDLPPHEVEGYDAAYDAGQDAGQPVQGNNHNLETAQLYERLIQQQADEIAHLRGELERERDRATRERERADTIIMQLSRRPIELAAPASAMADKGPTHESEVSQEVATSTSTQPQPPAPAPSRPWWRFWSR